MSSKDEPTFGEQISDPQSFVLSLIGAEVLARRGDEGPLARPHTVARPVLQNDDKKKVRRG
ncbi:MAG: hypothetical protein JXX29_08525 [Deltaproteobacteria bacterium]|nr:hypothetical protein [Deltaproteobacteria bacterium]MBN2671706.1 hypothetical protein [Deltaproteobacteria bacterium]